MMEVEIHAVFQRHLLKEDFYDLGLEMTVSGIEGDGPDAESLHPFHELNQHARPLRYPPPACHERLDGVASHKAVALKEGHLGPSTRGCHRRRKTRIAAAANDHIVVPLCGYGLLLGSQGIRMVEPCVCAENPNAG